MSFGAADAKCFQAHASKKSTPEDTPACYRHRCTSGTALQVYTGSSWANCPAGDTVPLDSSFSSGSYVHCPTARQIDSWCMDSDPCARQPCYPTATCTATSTTAYTCSCPNGLSGLWCEPNAPTCSTSDAPTVAHSKRTCSSAKSCSYSCDSGYNLSGSSTISCSAGTWGTPPTCTDTCSSSDAPTVAHAKRTCSSATSCSYSCDAGYSMSGSPSISCSAGTWSTPPTCTEVTCGTAPAVGNATSTCAEDGSYCTYKCASGFELVGTARVSCQASGDWSAAPACEPVRCKAEPTVFNGRVTCDADLSSCAASCYDRYRRVGPITVTCTSGVWSEIPTCSRVKAATLPEVAGAIRSCTADRMACEFACQPNHVLTPASGGLVHWDGKAWSATPTCEILNPCLQNNGGCGDERINHCVHTGTGASTCECESTYSFGTWPSCPARDSPCQTNNGGCGAFPANVCATSGAQVLCSCGKGYAATESGCEPINPCDSVACTAANSRCLYLGPDQHQCVCAPGYTATSSSTLKCIPSLPSISSVRPLGIALGETKTVTVTVRDPILTASLSLATKMTAASGSSFSSSLTTTYESSSTARIALSASFTATAAQDYQLLLSLDGGSSFGLYNVSAPLFVYVTPNITAVTPAKAPPRGGGYVLVDVDDPQTLLTLPAYVSPSCRFGTAASSVGAVVASPEQGHAQIRCPVPTSYHEEEGLMEFDIAVNGVDYTNSSLTFTYSLSAKPAPGAPVDGSSASTAESTNDDDDSGSSMILIGGISGGVCACAAAAAVGVVMLKKRKANAAPKKSRFDEPQGYEMQSTTPRFTPVASATKPSPFSPAAAPALPSRPPPAGRAAPPAIPARRKNVRTVAYDYQAANADELSIAAGDSLEIVKEGADGWGEAVNQRTRERGLVPLNFVNMD
eukprot:GCRY01002751.1.p1 GENE.GCRY01002751.1~~GCRY01002751.1.p1  ORF type:complete len:914 (-),score=272.36 GCRY01002751.1:645-3386(-)